MFRNPFSTTSDCTDAESVTITLDTDYPNVWQDLLSDYIKAGLVSVSNQTKTIIISSSALLYISLPAQPSQGAVSAGILTFSKELPAVLTFPAAIKQNATTGKNVTSAPTLTVTLTPTLTVRGRVSGGGGGGGVVIAERAKVSTKNAIVQKLPRGWAATLKLDYDFKDYEHGYVRFAYKKVGDADWEHTDWIGAYHSASYDELIMGLEDPTTYYFYAQLEYGDENNINGVTLTFKTLAPR